MPRLLPYLLLFWLLVAPVMAQNSYLGGTPAEQEGLRLLDQYKLVKLREVSRMILRDDPTSFAGHYLMGYSLHNSEGDLPRAKFHLNKALQLFIDEHGETPSTSSAPWGWYERTILELVQVNAEMDAYDEQIKALDRYVALYRHIRGGGFMEPDPPSIVALYAWPLMKLKKEDEARAKLDKVAKLLQDPRWFDERTRTTYLNTLGAMEMEFGNPEASYQAFKTLVDEVRSRGWSQTATYLRNLGEAAAGVGQYAEAERYYSEATRWFDRFTYSNPWFDLAFLYLSQARFSEAIDALKKTHEWRFRVQPFLAQQSWAQDQHVTAELMLHLGEIDKALEITENIVRRPDRQGGDSIQLDQKEAGTLMLYRALLMAQAAATQESLSWVSGMRWWKAHAYRRELLARATLAELKIKSLATNHERVKPSLRPYYAPGTFVVADWHRPDLVEIYGPGVASEALTDLYQNPVSAFQWEKPALDVIRAEIAWQTGEEEEAITILREAIPELGQTRGVLRARAEARLTGILFDESRFEEAMDMGARVFDTAPSMFRHLGIAVPVRLETDGSDACETAARALASSPRFYVDGNGFPIKIRKSNGKLVATLTTREQALLAEVSVSAVKEVPKKPEPAQTPAEGEKSEKVEAEEPLDPPYALAAEFHKKAFAPRIDLSQGDINSLDGSTLSESRRSDDRRKAIGLPPGQRPGH